MSAPGPRISRFEAVLLTALFVIVITLPLCKQWIAGEPDTEAIEGRRLNVRPHFSLKSGLKEFPSEFEAYYNDHFGFRTVLLRVGSYVGVKYANVPLSPDVIIGKDGWLFKRYGQSMDTYHGGPLFSDEELEQWKRSLEYRQRWLAKRGIKYLFVISPEKQTIYPELMPDKYSRFQDQTPGGQFADYLSKHSTVPVLSLIGPVMKAKAASKDRLYFRHDTHWNTLGAYVGYREIVDRLGEWFPELKPTDRSQFKTVMEYNKGDLARIMGMPDYSAGDEPTLKPLVPPVTTTTPFLMPGVELLDNRDYTIDSPGAESSHRLLLMHDSFMWAVIPMLSANFSQVACFFRFQDDRQYEEVLAEAVKREKPDIFIEERIERYLLLPPPDGKIIFGGGE